MALKFEVISDMFSTSLVASEMSFIFHIRLSFVFHSGRTDIPARPLNLLTGCTADSAVRRLRGWAIASFPRNLQFLLFAIDANLLGRSKDVLHSHLINTYRWRCHMHCEEVW